MPAWLLGYKYNEKSYQVVINVATGEVQGEHPDNRTQITLATLAALAVILTVWLLTRGAFSASCHVSYGPRLP